MSQSKFSLSLIKPLYPQAISINKDNLFLHSLETPSRIFKERSRDLYRSHDKAGHMIRLVTYSCRCHSISPSKSINPCFRARINIPTT